MALTRVTVGVSCDCGDHHATTAQQRYVASAAKSEIHVRFRLFHTASPRSCGLAHRRLFLHDVDGRQRLRDEAAHVARVVRHHKCA
jgi:hypothetical protein